MNVSHDLPILTADDAAAIAAVCARGLADPPSEDELRQALFAPDHPCVVRGVPDVGAVATAVRRGVGRLRLLVVDPDHRRRGLGSRLLAAAEHDARAAGADTVTAGHDGPDYLWPGVDARALDLASLLEREGYRRTAAEFNMAVDLAALPALPAASATGRPVPAEPWDREEVAFWMEEHWEAWTDEVLRALDRRTLLVARDEDGIAGFCAWDVNRRGWLGPIAVRPGQRGQGIGRPLLLAALHEMRASGLTRAEIAWVGPIRFYVETVAATISRPFLVYEKRLA